MKWRTYPAYKDSGIEWLGKIPEDWKVLPLKRLGRFKAGAGFPEDEQGIEDGELPFYKVSDMNLEGNEIFMKTHNNSVSQETAARLRAFVFPSETLIFAKVGAALLLNKRRILTRPSCIDNNTMGFMRSSCSLKWLYHWMCGLDLGELANPGAVPSINERQMREIPIPVPPEDEQQGIGLFLDRETAHIDALIAKKERQIELLQEKRAALISHTVTKGLDPDVPMKDSGVEWLGEIPAHWTRARIGYFARVLNGSTPSRNRTDYWTDGTIPWLSSAKVNDDVITEPSELITKIALRECPLEVIPSGSVVIGLVGQGRTRGMAAIMGIDATINQNMAAMIHRSKLRGRFLHYVLQHMYTPIREYGRGANQAALNCEVVAAIRIPIPPVHEQEHIANYLDIQNTQFTAICNRIKDGLTILREYRTALISAAVTGKIDVRET